MTYIQKLIVLAILASLHSLVAAVVPDIYKCVMPNGRVEFTDTAKPGCKKLELPGASVTIDQAQQLVQERLVDPDSATFKSLRQVQRTGSVCGRINSKNRMGGYNGFIGFVVTGGRVVRLEGETGFAEAYANNCE